VDRLLRIEEAIHIRRAHAQFFGDVGDGGLLVADLARAATRTASRAASSPAAAMSARIWDSSVARSVMQRPPVGSALAARQKEAVIIRESG
jgi:hypothetical protein